MAIPLRNTNFPFNYCTFSPHKPIFWKIALLEYNAENFSWRITVVDYNVTDRDRLKRQKSTRPVQQLIFEKFDWNKLEPWLSGYLSPDFGFIFFIEGEVQNHFVWELLNSHATYIWSIEKDEEEIDRQFTRIEASINSIRSFGRERYKKAYEATITIRSSYFQ